MKSKIVTLNFALILLVCGIPKLSNAQDSSSFKHYDFGFGAAFNDFRFYFPMFIHDKIKIEPEIKYSLSSSSKSGDDFQDIEIGLGSFYRINFVQMETYIGFRFGYHYYKSENENIYYLKSTGYYISPTIGGEYFIFERFSLGAELQFKYMDEKSERNYHGDNSENYNNRGYKTYTYFMMRFYIL